MRGLIAALLASTIAGPVIAQEAPPPPPQEIPLPPPGQDAPPRTEGAGFATALGGGGVLEFTPAKAAGLPEGIKPVTIGWDAAYRLALSKGRGDDRAAILKKADPLSADEFARVRAALVPDQGRDPAAFRDPTPLMLNVLLTFHRAQSSRRRVASRELVLRLFSEYVRGGASSGVKPADLDRLVADLMDARRDMIARIAEHRNSLDELKALLRLPPGTPLVADLAVLSGFDPVFQGLDRWAADEKNDYAQLPPILDGMPNRPDLVIGGRSLVDAGSREPGEESIIAAATKAITDDQLAFSARKRLRRLAVVGQDFEMERTRLLVMVKARDATQQRLIAPPVAITSTLETAAQTRELLAAIDNLVGSEERIVAAWIEGQGLRHALMVELGTLPRTRDEFMAGFSTARPVPASK